jgi:hypothetical protein
MMAVNVPFIVAWVMFHYASNVGTLYASLALTGLSGGLMEAPVSFDIVCCPELGASVLKTPVHCKVYI